MHKKRFGLLLAIASATAASAFSAVPVDVICDDGSYLANILNVTDDIPVIELPSSNQADANWQFLPDHAQYSCASWTGCIGIAHNLTVAQAKEIGQNNPDVVYFFYVKGGRMVLENTEVYPAICRVFNQGDAVFFGGSTAAPAWWGSAPGLSDGYVKLSPAPAQ